MSEIWDVIVIGAGAAGMMCALEAAQRGRRVLIVDHAKAPGEKIRISGGARCNFTNISAAPDKFISRNKRFSISALSRYSVADFVAMIEGHGIAYHEKKLGQLFCDGSARQIVDMFVDELRAAGARMRLNTEVADLQRVGQGFSMSLNGRVVLSDSVVVACGGKSIPKMGATGLGYQIAKKFDLQVEEIRPGLVPLTFSGDDLARLKELAGVSVEAEVTCNKMQFREALLFTHRGLSGPAILQISSYWREGDALTINLVPGVDMLSTLKAARTNNGKQALSTVLSQHLPKRLALDIAQHAGTKGNIADMPDKLLATIAARVAAWRVQPSGSEGYRIAEVTVGGVSTDELDARTMQVKSVPGLYFVGEVVDVTGWLGGYNFQWAWASGWAAGQDV